MGIIIKDDVEYSGGGTSAIEVTQAEYDQMKAAGTLQTDVPYFIKDAAAGDGSGLTVITYTEYMAHKSQYDSDGKMYYVEGGGDVIGAADVPYDNTTSSIASTNVQGAIDAVNENLAKLKYRLLWTNSSPSSQFSAQTISIDLSDYDYVDIAFTSSIGTTTEMRTHRVFKNTVCLCENIVISSEKPYLFARKAQVNDSGVVFDVGRIALTNSSSVSSGDNKYQIPYKIYGGKFA